MSKPEFTVTNLSPRLRQDTLFRLILAVPHLVLQAAWLQVAQVLAVFQWVVILYTGKRNEAIWKLQSEYLAYSTRVNAYVGLLYDKWPAIGREPEGEPVTYSFAFSETADRRRNFYFFVRLIPAFIVLLVVTIGTLVATIVSWFAILATGRHPGWLFDFLLKAHRFAMHVVASMTLMTEDYPRYGA